ncbi:hypothetical protein B484DRAFT_473836, partial [Ochromonadaceae sp. CCMP2298]
RGRRPAPERIAPSRDKSLQPLASSAAQSRDRAEEQAARARLLGSAFTAEPHDADVHCEYLVESRDGYYQADKLTIFRGDLRLLGAGSLLNERLVNFCVQFANNSRPSLPDTGARMVCLEPEFFQYLSSSGTGKHTDPHFLKLGHVLVGYWSRKFDLFAADFVLIPILRDLHWSLAVIVRPSLLRPSLLRPSLLRQGSAEDSDPDQPASNLPCILHMDSAKGAYHSSEIVGAWLNGYLRIAWIAQEPPHLASEPDYSSPFQDLPVVQYK